MRDPAKNPFEVMLDSIRLVVREEIAAANCNCHQTQPDRLLTPQEAATILGQSVPWLYRHAAKFPFTRRISRRNLRFSEAGLRRWIAAKTPGSR